MDLCFRLIPLLREISILSTVHSYSSSCSLRTNQSVSSQFLSLQIERHRMANIWRSQYQWKCRLREWTVIQYYQTKEWLSEPGFKNPIPSLFITYLDQAVLFANRVWLFFKNLIQEIFFLLKDKFGTQWTGFSVSKCWFTTSTFSEMLSGHMGNWHHRLKSEVKNKVRKQNREHSRSYSKTSQVRPEFWSRKVQIEKKGAGER